MDRCWDGRQAVEGGARAIYVPFERKGQGKQNLFSFANEWLYPAITACKVDQCGDYPTHRPLIIEVSVEQMEKAIREYQKRRITGKSANSQSESRS